MSLNRSIAKDSIKTTSVTFVVQAASFFISAIIAALYGATGNTDAYFYALSLVLIFTTGITGILKAVFIPVFLRFRKEDPNEEREMLGSFYYVFILFLSGLWVLFVLISLLLTFVFQLQLGGIDPYLLGKLLFQMSLLIILTGLVECYSTVYNAYQRFVLPLITPLIRSAIFIGFVFASRNLLGVQSLSIGNVVGEFIQLSIIIISLKYAKIPLRPIMSIHKSVKRMIKISLPPFLSNATTRISNLVDNTFIAPLFAGSVTILNYSSKIAGIPEMLLTGAFLTVVLSYWSLTRSEEGLSKVGDSLKKALMVLGFVFIPLVSFMYFLRLPLVQVMYERKNFTPALSNDTAILLGYYMIGILPLILGRLLTRAFLVIEDTWTPFWVGNIRFALKVVANIIFIKLFGFIGVAIASSLTAFFMFGYMYVKLKSKIKIQRSKDLMIEYSKLVFSGILAGFVVLLLYGYVVKLLDFGDFINRLSSLAIASIFGLFIYLLLAIILKTKSVNYVKGVVLKR